MQRSIAERYAGLDVDVECWPADDCVDERAYEKAFASFAAGDLVVIATPDDSHFALARAAVARGMHVLVVKPLVRTLEEHHVLRAEAEAQGVLVVAEHHKRFDPMYADARDRMRGLGDMSFFQAYMSQPRFQLETFRAWAGLSSDISDYLNAHHIDFHAWALWGLARPTHVVATSSSGIASAVLGRAVDDTIALTVGWENLRSGRPGIGLYTASWVAPLSDVHSQQRFFYLAEQGELQVDQAHRGYAQSTDEKGFASLNPLFMKYTPTDGRFAGQQGYGYRSVEETVGAVAAIHSGQASAADFEQSLATVSTTMTTTAVLEAGRRSLATGGKRVHVVYGSDPLRPVDVRLEAT
jgi:D-galacturonate reductase